jgi:tetratricopeptide (TPR) repeat protein
MSKDVNAVLHMLSQTTISSLNHWLYRIDLARQDADEAPELFIPDFLVPHLEWLYTLITKAAALPDTHSKAADLVLELRPLIAQHGRENYRWVNAVRGLAVGMCNPPESNPELDAVLWRTVGDSYRKLNQHRQSVVCYNTAAQLLAGETGEPTRDLLNEIMKEKASTRALQTRFDDAVQIAEDLYASAKAWGDRHAMASVNQLMAYVHIQSGHHRKALAYAQQSVVGWRQLREQRSEAVSLNYMGELYRAASCHQLAETCLKKAQSIYSDLCEFGLRAYITQALGALAVEQGHYDAAVTHLTDARAYFEEQSDARSVASCTHALGVAYYRQGDYKAAADHLLVAIQRWKSLEHNTAGLMNIYYVLGKAYHRMGQHYEAMTTLLTAREHAVKATGMAVDNLLKNIDEELDELR